MPSTQYTLAIIFLLTIFMSFSSLLLHQGLYLGLNFSSFLQAQVIWISDGTEVNPDLKFG